MSPSHCDSSGVNPLDTLEKNPRKSMCKVNVSRERVSVSWWRYSQAGVECESNRSRTCEEQRPGLFMKLGLIIIVHPGH